MEIYVRDIQNYMIKPFDNYGLAGVVDSMTLKVLISYTTLRSFIPPQVHKMTPKLCQVCECELCIIPKYMHIGLNIFRTIIVTYLQQKYVGIHMHNILFNTTSDSYYKDILFPDGEFLLVTIKDSVQCIAYIPIQPNNPKTPTR